MPRVEKTVFISYRRTNAPWALAIYQDLTRHGYDVFFDYMGIASGDFESIILENIRARAHFLVLLTPSALERCGEPEDWLRREIEEAIERRRNIVPLMLEGFDFSAPSIASQLTGKLAALKQYNGLTVSTEYFNAAMERLRETFLNVPLAAVLQPASAAGRAGARVQQEAAATARAVGQEALSAIDWILRAARSNDLDEKLSCFDEAIRLDPDSAEAYASRGLIRELKFDRVGALKDFNESIRLDPTNASNHVIRGNARRGNQDFAGAFADYGEAIRLEPGNPEAYVMRGRARRSYSDPDGAIKDFSEAIRLHPDDARVYGYRAFAWEDKGNRKAAIADFQTYLDKSDSDVRDRKQIEERIRRLRTKR